MDCIKAGQLIYRIRKEKGMTQKEVADALNISDKTISKWERGLGYPDISLIGELSNVLGVNVEKLLEGDLSPNLKNPGNLNRIRFYLCSECGNILYSAGKADISCCGRKLLPLEPKEQDSEHEMTIEEIENDFYITFNHEMTKEHFLTFIAFVHSNQVLLIKLYPEQNPEIRVPKQRRGTIYICCTKHGLRKIRNSR